MSHYTCIRSQNFQAREVWILTCEWFTGEQRRGLALLGNLVWQTQITPMLLVTLAKPEAEVSYKNLFQIAAPIHNNSLNFIQRIFPGTLKPYIHFPGEKAAAQATCRSCEASLGGGDKQEDRAASLHPGHDSPVPFCTETWGKAAVKQMSLMQRVF